MPAFIKTKLSFIPLIYALVVVATIGLRSCNSFAQATEIQYHVDNNGIRLYPQSDQLYPRDDSNKAVVTIKGKAISSTSIEEIVLVVYKKNLDNTIDSSRYALLRSDTFSFYPTIEAGMHLYNFKLYLEENGAVFYSETLAKDVVCGDVYIISGQSNAMGILIGDPSQSVLQDSAYREYPSKGSKKIYSKTLGRMPLYNGKNGAVTNCDPNDKNWLPATAVSHKMLGLVGVWALKLQYLIQEKHQMPTCVINGSYGNSWLLKHQINYSPTNDPYDLTTLFGCLNYRIKQANIKNRIKGVIWYQGEAQRSGKRALTYADSLNKLVSDWEAYWGDIEKFYLVQIHTGCGRIGFNKAVREQQRSFQRPANKPQNVVVLTANGIGEHSPKSKDPYHLCHFNRTSYNNLTDRIFQLVSRDFYGGTNTITSPNIVRAYYESGQLVLEFDQDLADFPKGLEHFFLFYKNEEELAEDKFKASNFYTSANKLYLTVSNQQATSVSYLLEKDPVYNNQMIWLKNPQGYAAFSFHQFPIQAEKGNN